MTQFFITIVSDKALHKTAPVCTEIIDKLRTAGVRDIFLDMLSENAIDILYSTHQTNNIQPVLSMQNLAIYQKTYDIATGFCVGRKKKICVSDMDKTVINHETLDDVADILGIGNQIHAITQQAMAGHMDFEESLKARVKLLQGKSLSAFEKVHKNLQYNIGADVLIRTLNHYGCITALVSGGFTITTQVVADCLGFKYHYGNTLGCESVEHISGNSDYSSVDSSTDSDYSGTDSHYSSVDSSTDSGVDSSADSAKAEQGIFVQNTSLAGLYCDGSVVGDVVDAYQKARIVQDLCQQYNTDVSDVMTIGDGANDLEMHAVAGLPIAYYAKPVVMQAVPIHLNHTGLETLLYFQGYKKSEWVYS